MVLHGGKPAVINDPEVSLDKVGLRIDWPGKKDESLLSEGRELTRNISWEEFFDVLERENLDFEYSEQEGVAETWSYRFVPRFAPLA